MTFIDISGEPPSAGLIAGYSILCVVALLCTGWAVNLGRNRLHYRSFFSVRVLFPLALFIIALENVGLAASGRFYNKEGGGEKFSSNLFFRAVFALQTFEVPILLVVVFELTYLVHKRRSVNFCGMYFDEGRRVDNTAVMSCMLRNSIRSLAVVLWMMGLVVNFDFIRNDAPVDELAGRAGWSTLFLIDTSLDEKVHLLLSLVPTAVLTSVCFYLSIMLWRYGTESAMVVHSSMLNPWFYLFFGTLALGGGQIFGEELYPIMSNVGMLIFIITILALMVEVDKDIIATQEVACFLVQVAHKGDKCNLKNSTKATRRHDRHESSDEKSEHRDQFHSEEKQVESTEIADGTLDVEVPRDDSLDDRSDPAHSAEVDNNNIRNSLSERVSSVLINPNDLS